MCHHLFFGRSADTVAHKDNDVRMMEAAVSLWVLLLFDLQKYNRKLSTDLNLLYSQVASIDGLKRVFDFVSRTRHGKFVHRAT